MAGYVEGVDRGQATLFPHQLDDFVGADNPVRVVDAFVDALDLHEVGFARAAPESTGRPGYHPAVLLNCLQGAEPRGRRAGAPHPRRTGSLSASARQKVNHREFPHSLGRKRTVRFRGRVVAKRTPSLRRPRTQVGAPSSPAQEKPDRVQRNGSLEEVVSPAGRRIPDRKA